MCFFAELETHIILSAIVYAFCSVLFRLIEIKFPASTSLYNCLNVFSLVSKLNFHGITCKCNKIVPPNSFFSNDAKPDRKNS